MNVQSARYFDDRLEPNQTEPVYNSKKPYITPRLTPLGQMERITLQDTGGIIDDGEIT